MPEVDVIHTFNMVCQTEKDWMASFETMLPRLPCKTEWEKKYYVELAEAILKGNCKGIFALCKNAYDIHKTILEGRLPAEMAKKVLDKTFVLHPPQSILISEEEIAAKVKELGERISRDYQGKNLMLVSVLKGSLPFMADLMREITMRTTSSNARYVPLVASFIGIPADSCSA